MPLATSKVSITDHAPIRTWFGVGGGADRFASPLSVDELRQCLELDTRLRVLGDGANLLVDDDGVGELVVSLEGNAFRAVDMDAATGRVRVGAGADLPKLIHETVRCGLAGLEGLIGIPATVGGACIMNAGGAFGQIADSVAAVHALDRSGREVTLRRDEIAFAYRESGLGDAGRRLIITSVDFQLTPSDPVPLRDRLKECMAYKKRSQPMAADSAGCCFKNPTLTTPLCLPTGEAFAVGTRASAGLLIDRAGCKGLRVRRAEVSPVHANFLVTSEGARAHDVIDLMEEVTRRVFNAFGITLQREVVVWSRNQ